MIYRLSLVDIVDDTGHVGDGHKGYRYYATKNEAEYRRRCFISKIDSIIDKQKVLENKDLLAITEQQIPKGKKQLLKLLTLWGSHCDNG